MAPWAGQMLGPSPRAHLVAENAVRNAERGFRAAIGLVTGMTSVTIFAVALESFRATIRAAQ